MTTPFFRLSPGGKSLVVGIPAVITMYYAFWTSYHRQQRRKLLDDGSPAAIPTWEHRMMQTPRKDADNPATLRATIFGHNEEAKTGGDTDWPKYSDSPVARIANPPGQQDAPGGHIEARPPQRGQKSPGVEGAPYTKRPEYFESRS